MGTGSAILGLFEAVEKKREDIMVRLVVVRHVLPQVVDTRIA